MQVTFFGLQFYYDDLIEYPAGHYLLKEGQKQNCIYVLKKGKVKILKNSQEIALCDQRGDMFGEVAALTGEECSSTVRLAEASEFFVIEDADQFLVKTPAPPCSSPKCWRDAWRILRGVMRSPRWKWPTWPGRNLRNIRRCNASGVGVLPNSKTGNQGLRTGCGSPGSRPWRRLSRWREISKSPHVQWKWRRARGCGGRRG